MRHTVCRAPSLLMLVCLCVPALAQDKPAAKSKPTVDFKKLKELMPAQVAGLKRTTHDGQNQAAGASSMSIAKAVYDNQKPGDAEAAAEANPDAPPAPTVQVTIIDYANAEGGTAVAAAWTKNPVNTQTDDGYQKSLKVAGFPAMEIYDKVSKSGQLQVYVAERFIVAVNTQSLAPEKMQEVAKALQLEKLATLK